MAPTRKRRTSSAAAAAAAAAAQWKVGDLVLAKLKGYPAWPAMITEPQEWGHSPVKKKLLVCFYGTKEIAFCNYADLEAFTEEKKKSLLVKRHGKGADFVRAVKEIVEIFDSRKKEDNENSDLGPAKNSSNLYTGGPEDGSDLANDNKLDGNPASPMDHSMASTPGSNIAALESEHCVVNSAPDEPTSSFSKRRQNNAQQLDSFTHGNLASARRPRSSLGADHRTRDSCGLNGPNLPSVDMILEDKQEGSSRHKFIGDDKSNSDFLSAKKGVTLFSCSQGTSSQSGTSGNGNDEKNSSSANVENTLNVEVCQTVMDREDNLNEVQDIPTSTTVTFKRKRKPDTNDINNSVISMVPHMDEELQPKSSGNTPDSPNSGNEVNKSDGDDHLPLVKRARVRMGRPQLEDSIVDEPGISDNKTELAMPADQCYQQDLSSVAGKDYPADEAPPGIDPSPEVDISLASGKDHSADKVPPSLDPSPKVDLSLASGEVQTACNNKECQSKVLTLDGEAALPPSKRLHRALEAMSANAAETITDPSEVNKPKDFILKPSTTSIARSPSNNSADAPLESPKTAPTKSSEICATTLDTPTSQKYDLLPVIVNNDSPSSVSLEFTNGNNHDLPKDEVHNRVDDVCGKSPTCSLDSKEPAVVSELDQLPLGKASRNELPDPITNSSQDFSKNIDGSSYPLGPAKTVVSGTNEDCNTLPHDEPVLAEPTVCVVDRTSVSLLVTKVTCGQSVAGAQAFETHGSSAMSLKESDRRMNPKDTSLSPDSMPMKELIAAAHARRLSQPTSFIDSFLDSNVISPSANIPSAKEGSGGRCSPSNNNTIRSASDRVHTQQNSGTILFDDMEQKSLNKLPGHDEARSARRAFENFLGTLTRTKECIARATRLALDCAKHGIAGEVMDVIIERLEKESNLYKRVDLFFLVDSIIQCCRNQKGGVGDAYPSLIQAVLPRILYASAPPGNFAWENRRQCLKVLKLWLERKTLSEYIIRHHIKELEALNEAAFGTSRRPSGTERALNDPLRDNEGMLVDEYGSNTGFHLPNLIGTKLLDEEGSSSEDRSFEAVTPEHESAGANEQEGASQVDGAKHRLVFEEVNGDLEMEDVSPSSEAKVRSAPDLTDARCTVTNRNVNSVPPLPDDKPPTPPPLPSSPPPLPRPPYPVFQGSQVQGASHLAADRVDPDNLRNVQDQHPHSIPNNRGKMDPCVVPLQPPVPYTSGCAGHTNQILPPPPLPPPPPPPPVAQFHPPGPHGNFSGPPVPHHGNNFHHPPSAPLPNNAYHLHPPPHPPGPPNQFPYMPPEHQQRIQPWNCNSPYPEGYQYNGHDRGPHPFDRRHHFDDRWHHFDDRGRHFNDGGHHFDAGGHYFDDGPYHYDDRGHHFNDRGQMHPEAVDRGGFPPHFGPDPPYPDHFDHGRPLDHPPGPCAGWAMPPRRSKFPPGSRHSMDPPISHEGGWRRQGRHNNDRFHR